MLDLPSWLRSTMLAVGLATSLAGCTVHGQGALVVRSPPPRERVVHVTPRAGHVWVPGRWISTGGDWHWRDGYWVRERPGHVYVEGRWQRAHGQHRWVEGRWESRRHDRTWVPGRWGRHGNRQIWIRGHWEARVSGNRR